MNAISASSVGLVITAILCSCADAMYHKYSGPYVVFEPEHHMTIQGVVPAIVMTIDGASVPLGGKDPVKPGLRRVSVSISGAAGAPILEELTVDAKPCMRYYLGAKGPAQSGEAWRVIVTTSEPIRECRQPLPY